MGLTGAVKQLRPNKDYLVEENRLEKKGSEQLWR